MKSEQEIMDELNRRIETLERESIYTNYRINNTIISTLRWVLDFPTKLRADKNEN